MANSIGRSIIGVLLLSNAGGPAIAVEPKSPTPTSEPTSCYRMVGGVDSEMTVGLAVELCAGTTNAKATITCYALAFVNKESGGLGLNRGLAVSLCRAGGGSNRQ